MVNQDIYKKQSDAIWDIANLLRGPYRPPQYRRVMIPFTVLRPWIVYSKRLKKMY